MSTPIILLLKSLVAGYTRKDGTYVRPHSRKGGPAAKPGAGQLSLFAKPTEPAKPNPFKGKDPVKDTLPLFDADEHGEIPPARPAAVPVDGKANKKIDWSVGETLIPGHDVMAAWNPDSAEGGHPDNLTVYMAGTNGAKDHIILEHGGKGVFAVTESVVENAGQGIGGKLYRALIDFLGSQGLTFHSDSELSPDSQRIYESLKKRGYRVETINAPARQANGWLVADGPIYSVTAPAKSEHTEPVHTAPVKEMIEEHERLVDVLESPSHADDKAEAKKQRKELEEYKREAEQPERRVLLTKPAKSSVLPDNPPYKDGILLLHGTKVEFMSGGKKRVGWVSNKYTEQQRKDGDTIVIRTGPPDKSSPGKNQVRVHEKDITALVEESGWAPDYALTKPG